MGYTHYIKRIGDLSKKNRAKWIEHTNGIIRLYNKTADASDMVVSCGEETLTLSDDLVRVNGYAEKGHETLYISVNGVNSEDFCKTAMKPYDAVVVACYKLAENMFPCVRFSSDGDSVDHIEGLKLLKEYSDLINV